MIRLVLIFCFFVLSCEDATPIRENASKPSEDAPDLPGYLDETTATVKAGEPAVISISRTELVVASDTFSEDVEVRLRTLESIPEREEVASLGEAMGDVVEVTVYNRDTQEIYPSSILEQTYSASQLLDDVSDEANLKYVVITAPGTDDELVQVLSRKAITSSAALTATGLSVSIVLRATHVIFYAVESAETSSSVIILDSGKDTSNDSGGSVSTSSTSSSTSTSSGGSGIDCSGLAGGVWIPVPANPVVGQNENFCVMKYEAKLEIDGVVKDNGDNPSNSEINLAAVYLDGDGVVKTDGTHLVVRPVSIPEGKPWAYVEQNADDDAVGAIQLCASLGSGYELITNEMWQTIARNIETAQSVPGTYYNWSGGSIAGATQLNRGNFDQNATLVADSDDANGCVGITSSPNDSCANAWHDKKRTHTLSNDEVIWDLAGNAFEWTSSTLTNQGADGEIAQKKWDGTLNQGNAADKLKWGPTHSYYDDDAADYKKSGDAGMGVSYLEISGGAVLRGGFFGSLDEDAGVFVADLGSGPSEAPDFTGFRCGRPAD